MRAKILSMLYLYLLVLNVYAKGNSASDRIALMNDAKVFAQFSDEMSFVVNYFTQAKESGIVAWWHSGILSRGL